jgi:hypothetical protein
MRALRVNKSISGKSDNYHHLSLYQQEKLRTPKKRKGKPRCKKTISIMDVQSKSSFYLSS